MAHSYRNDRSIVINAAPDDVLATVGDLARWCDWSPFYRAEPSAEVTVSTPSSGVGAKFTWSGPKSGVGVMRITKVVPHESVHVALDFMKPIKDSSVVVWSVQEQGAATLFTWSMTGERNLPMRALAFVFRMDRFLCAQFDEGNGYLKQLIETSPESESTLT